MSETSNPKGGLLDRAAILLSGLCLVHCVATSVVVMLLASAGGILVDPRIHEVGLGVALLLGIVALGKGIATHRLLVPGTIGIAGLALMAAALTVPHGPAEIACTIVGVALLALGHHLNRRALAVVAGD